MVIRCTIYLLCSLLFLLGCKKANERSCLKAWGEENQVYHDISKTFDSLDIVDNMIVHLYQDSVQYLEVRGGANVIEFIKPTVENNTLKIRDHNKCNFLRSYKKEIHVDLHYRNLNYLNYHGGEEVIMENTLHSGEFRLFFRDGGGTVHCDVDVGYLSVNVLSGAGDFTAQGHATSAYLKVQANAFGDASDLIAEELVVFNNSSGNLYGRVEDGGTLSMEVLAQGSNYYYGDPADSTLIDNGEGMNKAVN